MGIKLVIKYSYTLKIVYFCLRMKTKILHISIACLLLISTLGVTINKHFCGNRLISASIFSDSNSCCKGNCDNCHNEFKNIRIIDAFESSFTNEIIKTTLVCLQPFYYSNDLLITYNPDIRNQFNNDISPHEILKSASLLQIFRL